MSLEAADYRVLTDYICRKTGGETDGGQMGMEKAFYKLVDILDGIRRGTNIHRQNGTDAERRMIVWD